MSIYIINVCVCVNTLKNATVIILMFVRELKTFSKQHLKFINRCNHLPQTHKKLLLKLFIDKKSYRQIYCLVHSSGCNKNVLKGVQIPCPGPIVHIMKKR